MFRYPSLDNGENYKEIVLRFSRYRKHKIDFATALNANGNELNDCSGGGTSLNQNGQGDMLLDCSADGVVLKMESG